MNTELRELRDKFATAAITGMANTFIEAEDLAKRAWNIADEMMKRRGLTVTVELPDPIPEKPSAKTITMPRDSKEVKRPVNINTLVPDQKKDVLPLLDVKGKSTTELQSDFKKVYGEPISYAQLIYKLPKLVKKGLVTVDKRGKPFLWKLVENKSVKPPEQVNGKKLEFAKELGYENIMEAVAKEGPFEFAEKYEQWKMGK